MKILNTKNRLMALVLNKAVSRFLAVNARAKGKALWKNYLHCKFKKMSVEARRDKIGWHINLKSSYVQWYRYVDMSDLKKAVVIISDMMERFYLMVASMVP